VEPGEDTLLILGVIMGKDGPPARRETPMMILEADSRAVVAALAEAGLLGVGNGNAI
jgi:hypothetical protein